MVLKEKGLKNMDYSSKRPKIAFELDEGGLTYDPEAEGVYGTTEAWKFENKIRKGDHVVVSERSTRDRKILRKATSEDETIIGVVITEPKWKADPDGTANEAPRTNKEAGTYKGRTGTVRLFGLDVQELPLATENTAISVNDRLKYDPDNNVYVTGGKNIAVFFPVDANKGGTVAGLIGFTDILA